MHVQKLTYLEVAASGRFARPSKPRRRPLEEPSYRETINARTSPCAEENQEKVGGTLRIQAKQVLASGEATVRIYKDIVTITHKQVRLHVYTEEPKLPSTEVGLIACSKANLPGSGSVWPFRPTLQTRKMPSATAFRPGAFQLRDLSTIHRVRRGVSWWHFNSKAKGLSELYRSTNTSRSDSASQVTSELQHSHRSGPFNNPLEGH